MSYIFYLVCKTKVAPKKIMSVATANVPSMGALLSIYVKEAMTRQIVLIYYFSIYVPIFTSLT